LRRWLDELDAAHGAAKPEQAATAEALIDELTRPPSELGVA
jgi:hypothetical protein